MRIRTPGSPTAALLTLLASLWLGLGQPAGAQVDVAYLANEGFLVKAGKTQILIDALFGEGLDGYQRVPAKIRRDLENAGPPFEAIELILSTHFHPDHFNAEAVVRHLRAQPDARFISTQQAVAKVIAIDKSLISRAQGFWPDEGKRQTLRIGELELTILRLHHGRDRKPEVQNLGFIIDIAGSRLLHVGDTEVSLSDVTAYDLGNADIDIAFLPSWFLVSTEQRKIADLLDAHHLVAMHLGAQTAPNNYFYPAKTRTGLIQVISELYPNAWIPIEPLARRKFKTPATDTKSPE